MLHASVDILYTILSLYHQFYVLFVSHIHGTHISLVTASILFQPSCPDEADGTAMSELRGILVSGVCVCVCVCVCVSVCLCVCVLVSVCA